MTIEQAIEQLDWYFDCDDGSAADYVTKKAYVALKNMIQDCKKERERNNELSVR